MVPEKMSPPEGLGVKSAAGIMHELGWRQKILLADTSLGKACGQAYYELMDFN